MKIIHLLHLACFAIGTMDAGNIEHRIVDGEVAVPGEVPSVVSIRSETGRHKCGGIIVTKRLVISSANCIHSLGELALYIQAGSIDLTQGGCLYNITAALPHPDYDPSTGENDIAIFGLASPILLNRYTQIAKLPPDGLNVPYGAYVKVAGWGLIFAKQVRSPTYRASPSVPTVACTSTECSVCQHPDERTVDLYIHQPLIIECGVDHKIYTSDPKYFCLGKSQKLYTCHGDEGGPVLFGNYTIGLISAFKVCEPWLPILITNISRYQDWWTNIANLQEYTRGGVHLKFHQ